MTVAEDGEHSILVNCELEGVPQILFPIGILRDNLDCFGFFVDDHTKVFLQLVIQLNGLDQRNFEIGAMFLETTVIK